MRRAVAGGVIIVAGLLSTGCGAAVARERQPAAAVGRIEVIDLWGSFVIADFPEGRRLISIDMRELTLYRNGDEIRIDEAGRPLSPRVPR